MGFSTAPLIATGCIMMRACHLNTCPVGIATQDPELRKRFRGTPEHVVNFFFFVAEEVREILASLGLHSLEQAIGRVDLLGVGGAVEHWKARGVDLTHLLTHIELPADAPRRRVQAPPEVLEDALDWELVKLAEPAIERGERVETQLAIRNRNRCVGGILSSHIAQRHGEEGLPEHTIDVRFEGSAGQSFGGWLAPGVTFTLRGDAQDYAGKGLSGGVFAIRPREGMGEHFKAEQNVIVGNTVLYGATAGRAFFRGLAGERFAVRNFAAGMSGGVAYVLDEDQKFHTRCNMGMVGLEDLSAADAIELRAMIEEHLRRTDSPVAARVLEKWSELLGSNAFVKVMPHDYKRVLRELAEEEAQAASVTEVSSDQAGALRPLDAVGEAGG
jgi:glutamate synthase domain-containing protein 3